MKEIIYKLNEEATKFYQENLQKSEVAREYLKQRQINEDSIKIFKLGYAPAGDELYNYLIAKGYTDEQINNSSLNIENNIDKFGNRVIFPIINEQGKVIAFGARAINGYKPKYLGSLDNLVYCKGKSLYGMNFAKNTIKDSVILVEGYIDLIILYQNNIKNVVALLGIAMTDSQIKLIKKYTSNVILALDNDKTGETATKRGIEALKYNNVNNIRIIKLDKAKDPDEFVKIKKSERNLHDSISNGAMYI